MVSFSTTQRLPFGARAQMVYNVTVNGKKILREVRVVQVLRDNALVMKELVVVQFGVDGL